MTDIQHDTYTPQRVVVIVAHADDIEFGMSGTITKWTDAGAVVTYVIVTDNSSGSNDPNMDLNVLIETRKREQIASAQVAGVHDVRFLGYKDGILQPTLELRRDLTRIIRECKPDVVMTLDPTMIYAMDFGYINHPDHRAAGEATLYAVFPSAETRPIFPELLLEGYEPHKVKKLYLNAFDHSTHIVDISETMERKIEALRCHASQLTENELNMVRQWSAEGGKQFGLAYAEGFRVVTLQREETAVNA
ncbi:MAG: PIG-L family deacetylase [Anaerolineae bacterium]